MKRKIKVKNMILILFIGIFLFSTTKIVLFLVDLHKSKNATKELIQDVIHIEIENNSQEEVFTIDFEQLLSINNDTIGWIRFNNDKVNNPIVHTSDNSYYLKHSFDKSYNQAGTIFMDYRNLSLNDRNVVLYGHAMLDDTMFGSLQDIFKDGFLDTKDNNYIQIYNKENALLTYQIFSYYIIEKEEYYITTSFTSDSEFYKFIDTITRRSYKNFDIEVSTNDSILTLSTCSGMGGTSKRKVVHAKRIETNS